MSLETEVAKGAAKLGVTAAKLLGYVILLVLVCGTLWLGAGWMQRTADENEALHKEVAELKADARVTAAVDSAMAEARDGVQQRQEAAQGRAVIIERRTEEVGRADPTTAEWLDQPVPRSLRDSARDEGRR